jgi:hypothetical protein
MLERLLLFGMGGGECVVLPALGTLSVWVLVDIVQYSCLAFSTCCKAMSAGN